MRNIIVDWFKSQIKMKKYRKDDIQCVILKINDELLVAAITDAAANKCIAQKKFDTEDLPEEDYEKFFGNGNDMVVLH